jgi:hypothetical protein
MIQQELDVQGVSRVEVAAEGDIAVAAWEREALSVMASGEGAESVRVERVDEVVRVHAADDVRLLVPRRVQVRLVRVNGDARVSGLQGGLETQQVSGDLRVHDMLSDVHTAQIAGDLKAERVLGSVRSTTVAGDLQAHELKGDLVADDVAGDLHVRRVAGSISVHSVAGDAVASEVGGTVSIDSVAGDLRVEQCRAVRSTTVSGDLRLREVWETTVLESVGGDASIEDCRGPVELRAVGGSLRARRIAAGLAASHVGGSVRLHGPFTPGSEYRITCSGSATIILPGDPAQASVTFELRGAGPVEIDVPLQDVQREPGVVRGRLGAGEAQVHVQSSGTIRLLAREADREAESSFEGVFEGIFAGVAAGMEGLEEGLKSTFTGFEGGRFERAMQELSERIARRAEEAARRAAEQAERRAQEIARRAEEAARRAAEKAAREAERMARHAERHSRQWGWTSAGGPGPWPGRGPAAPPPPPPPQRPQATEEERLMVLRMLSEGKITAEEAARLLEALGG